MRALSTAFNTASKAENIVYGYAVECEFTSGFARFNTSPSVLTINGNNFIGVGNLGQITTISEEATLSAKGINLSLSGLDTTLIGASTLNQIALQENPQGKPVRIWVCLFDANHVLINVPYPVGIWRMDTLSVKVGKTTTIDLTAESALADWQRPRVRYYTDGDQQARHVGDKFFEFLAPNIDKIMNWGKG